MTKKKLLIAGVGGMIVTALVVAVAMVFVFNSSVRYETQAQMLASVPTSAGAELDGRGTKLSGPLTCTTLPESNAKKWLVGCEGETTGAKSVQVFGATLVDDEREYYSILVDGKPVVKNARCLGADCKD
ncbi:hypothetical protein [Actinocorallia lasiicapitis]